MTISRREILKLGAGASHPGAQAIPIPGTTQPHHAEDSPGAGRGRAPTSPELRREVERFVDAL